MNGKKVMGTAIVLVLAMFLIFGCTAGTKTNLNTGQTTKNVSLSFDETYLGIGGTRLSTNEATLGDEVDIYFKGLTGFKVVDGNIYPGVSMDVTDLDGNSVLSKGNMFGDVTSDGIDPATIEKSISVTLTTGDPMESGKTYHVKVTMWDAKSAMSYLESTVDLKMK